jgi:hypothetical protein
MRHAISQSGGPELVLVLCAVIAVYSNGLSAYFHGDDFVALVDVVTKPVTLHMVDALTFHDTNFYWRPLGQVYYRAMYEAFGLDPLPFRLVNLGVFLITLTLLHRLCEAVGLPRVVAFATVLLVGLFPNHIVSVSWITNAPRLLATLCFIVCLLALHRGLVTRSFKFEALSFLAFVTACVFDEVTIALAPVPVAFALFVHHEYREPRRLIARICAMAVVVAVLLPPQFMFTSDDEPRLAEYGFSLAAVQQVTALAAQLTLPLADPNVCCDQAPTDCSAAIQMVTNCVKAPPMDVPFAQMPSEEWLAGLGTLMIVLTLLLFGRGLLRFLAVWVACALAPFALWDLDVVAPRFVYMASVPFSMIIAILGYKLVSSLRRPRFRLPAAGLVAAGLCAAAVFGAVKTWERDADWKASTWRYEVLAKGLRETREDIPPGSRLIIYNGIWPYFYMWPQSVVQTVYEDPSIQVVNVRSGTAGPKALPEDVRLYYSKGAGLHVDDSQ